MISGLSRDAVIEHLRQGARRLTKGEAVDHLFLTRDLLSRGDLAGDEKVEAFEEILHRTSARSGVDPEILRLALERH